MRFGRLVMYKRTKHFSFGRPLHTLQQAVTFFSSFPFETELEHLIDMITGMKNSLSQLVRRISEREALEDSGDLVFDTDQNFTQNVLQSVRENCKRNSYVIINNAVICIKLIGVDRVIE